jgi:hypothetical protein
MKIIFHTCLILSLSYTCFGQISSQQINALKQQLLKERHDSTRGTLALMVAQGYGFSNIDSSLFYTDLSLEIAKKLELPTLKAEILCGTFAPNIRATRQRGIFL